MKSVRHIVVDLDGTLVNSDLLIESLFIFIRLHPFRCFELLIWLLRGKVFFKMRLAEAVIPDPAKLPYNKDLIDWLIREAKSGASLCLATASHLRIARSVASYLGIFDHVIGTEDHNLSAEQKRKSLVSLFGENNYEYIGNSFADLAVWRSASVIYVSNPGLGVLKAARKIGPVNVVFENRTSYIKSLIKTLRIHQWTKNLLIFVPLFASHRFYQQELLFYGVLAFFIFGLCASSVYLLNDLLDIPDDRLHPSKCNRPLAAGTFPIIHSLILMPTLLVMGFGFAFLYLPISFFLPLSSYYILTIAYSLWIKRVVMLDVILLAVLYTIRVLAGAAAMSLVATFWILAFCMFMFLSLAFLKRYTELCDARQQGSSDISSGRGYYPGDFELLASLGSASGYLSVLVLALYINDATTRVLYHDPRWMWVACPILMFWLSRAWLLAHRGAMHDDPIIFALRDGVSRWICLSFLFVFILATLL